MAKKISGLDSAGALAGTEVAEIVQSGSKKVALSLIGLIAKTFAQINTQISDATLARTDATQTFTGAQSFASGGASDPTIRSSTVDPSAASGVAAPEGSLLMRFVAAAGELWVKTGAADTAWTMLSSGHPSISDNGSGDVVIASGKDILVQAGQGMKLEGLEGTGLTLSSATLAILSLNGLANALRCESGGVRIFGAAPKIENGSFSIPKLLNPTTATQSITGTGSTILANATAVKVTADGVYSLNATPIILAGSDGQPLYIENTTANAITLNDESTTAGSKIKSRGGADIVIAIDEIVGFRYSTDSGYWHQIE